MALSGVVGAQDEAAGTVEPTDEELTLSAPISVLLAEQLGNDKEAIFRFVADHVRDEPYSESAKATLRRALDDGWVAIAPERPVELGDAERVGWWLVDPSTGRLADQMDGGQGQDTIEWLGIQWTRAEVVALQAIGAILTAVLAYRGAKLYYDPPKLQEPGQGFKAVQQFFGW
jgi:hypothetical protein